MCETGARDVIDPTNIIGVDNGNFDSDGRHSCIRKVASCSLLVKIAIQWEQHLSPSRERMRSCVSGPPILKGTECPQKVFCLKGTKDQKKTFK